MKPAPSFTEQIEGYSPVAGRERRISFPRPVEYPQEES